MKRLLSMSLCGVMMISSLYSVYPVYAKSYQNIEKVAENWQDELVNVAQIGEISSSQITTDRPQDHGPNKIIDGDTSLSSFWDSGKREEGKDETWVVLDLKDNYTIEQIKLFNYWGNVYSTNVQRWYKYEIYTSKINGDWELAAVKDDEQPSTSQGDLYTLENPKEIRYIKVKCLDSNNNLNTYSGDKTMAHIVELQAFTKSDIEEKGNIALKKPTLAANGNTAYINDGIKTNYWDGGVSPQSFVIDLEDYYDISSFHAYPYYSDSRYYAYEISVSDNGFNYTKVAEKTEPINETANGTAFQMKDEVIARYVKVTMLKNSKNASVHMNEFEVYGNKVANYTPQEPSDPIDPDNIAFGKETRSNMSKNVSKWVVDGDDATSWTAFTYPGNVDIDLGEAYDLEDVVLNFPVADERYYQYSIYTSLDGVNFDRVAQKRNHEVADDNGDTHSLSNKTARYLRVNVEFVSQGSQAYLSEVRVHGSKSEAVAKDREKLSISNYNDTSYADAITKEDTIAEVYALIERRIGSEYKDWFTFELDDNDSDYYEISNTTDGKIHIKGNVGVSLTSGLYYYLKNSCNAQITQQGEQVNLPAKPISVTNTIRKDTPFEVRYAYNYCTLSYTYAFYGVEEWQRELDWLALNGVNVVLDTTGQEAVWVDFLSKFGYSTDDAESWLVGPGYTAWQFMSNMENYGGPINDQYVLDRLELARHNQRQMRLLGMKPVLQGYAGMIPSDYAKVVADKPEFKKYADQMMAQGSWGGQFERPAMLKTNSLIFEEWADEFYESQQRLLGDVTDYYAVDPFHEGGIPPADMSASQISETVLRKMMEHDDNSVWMIQSWEGNPTKALLDGLGDNKEDHAMILDLTATTDPRFNNDKWGEEFYGTPWVYCMLDNFGDRPGVHGELGVIASSISKASKNSKYMKGIGITPEGSKLNPVNYEMFFETVWNQEEINIELWLKDYITRRYGAYSETVYQGWLDLAKTAYQANGGHWGGVNSIANLRPDRGGPILGSNNSIPYNSRIFSKGIAKLLQDYDKFSTNENYRYDLAALLNQQLQNAQLTYYNNFQTAFKNKDLQVFNENSQKFLDSISIVDQISATQEDELLGTWIGKANDRSSTYDDFSNDMFVFNAKALITTWGGRDSAKTLGDYAYRQYSGLEDDYVKPRWEKHIANMRGSLENGTTYQAITYDMYFNDMWDFILDDKEYSKQTTDGATELKRLSEIVMNDYNNDQDKEVTDDNVAVNAFSSSSNGAGSGYGLNNLNDNDDTTLWVASSGKVPSSVTLDLDKLYPVYGVQLVFEKAPAAVNGKYMSFDMEIKENGEWKKILSSKTSKEQQTFDVMLEKPVDISSVRVTITGVDGTLYPAIAELRVFSSKGIMVTDTNLVKKEDKRLIVSSTVKTVGDLKKLLSVEAGELNIMQRDTELSDDAAFTDGAAATLTVNGVVVDELSIVVEKGDAAFAKSILKNVIDKTEGYINTGKLDGLAPNVAAMIRARLQEAKDVYNKEAAVDTECLTAWLNLANALQYLDFKADKTELEALIKVCEAIDTAEYTGGVDSFKTALAYAQDVMKDIDKLQDTIDTAYKNLMKAKDGLVKDAVDKALLNTLMEKVNSVIGDGSKYRHDTAWEAYQNAKQEANAVLTDANATQERVNEAFAKLANTYIELRLLPDEALLKQLTDFITMIEEADMKQYNAVDAAAIYNAKAKVKAYIAEIDNMTAEEAASIQKEMANVIDILNNHKSEAPAETAEAKEPAGAEEATEETADLPALKGTVKPGTTKTGDQTNMMGGAVLLLVSTGALAVLRKKRKD